MNPYEEIAKCIAKSLSKLSEMICFIAQRTLKKKDFDDFVNRFVEKGE